MNSNQSFLLRINNFTDTESRRDSTFVNNEGKSTKNQAEICTFVRCFNKI